MDEIIDEIGGVHEGGCGWAPDGTFCGECCKITCVGCPILNKEDE